MSELFSKAEDCYLLAGKLKRKLGDKIEFYGSTYIEIPSGKYLSSYRRSCDEYFSYNCNCLPFYFKYAENEFLRIGVGSHSSDNSLGEKLAALSDFYEVLSEEYGDPTVFYTTKGDDEGLLTLQWSFVKKEEEIAKFESGTYFDDAEVDTLIILGKNKNDVQGYNLKDKTKKIISRQVGLPFDLLYLIDEDIENYIRHKRGKEVTVPTDAKLDGIHVTSFKKTRKI